MRNKALYYPLLVGATLALAGCANEVDTMSTAVEETTTVTDQVVSNLNEIIEHESNLQSQFEQTLNEDAELATLGDGSATVYENIDSRETLLGDLESSNTEFDAIIEEVNGIEPEQFTTEEVESLYSSVDATSTSLESYISSYQTFLDNQRSYFESLGADDANYETFQTGIDSVQEEDAQIQELVSQLNSNLTQVNETVQTLSEKITALESENQ